MLGNLANLGSLLKQAQQMGSRLEGVTEELKGKRVTGSAGGGMVEVEVSGVQEVVACRIDATLFAQGDRELVEDLLRGATNQALAKSKQLHAEAMKALAGGMQLPGLDEALARLSGGPLSEE